MSRLAELVEKLAKKSMGNSQHAAPTRQRRAHGTYTTSEQTRQRVLDCAVEEINQVGYAKATTSAIAQRAGVSWGVLQYHFGSKVGLDYALVLYGMTTLAEGLEGLEIKGDSLEARIEMLVDSFYRIICSDHSRAGSEVVVNLRYRSREEAAHIPLLIEMGEELDRLLARSVRQALSFEHVDHGLIGVLMASFRGFNARASMLPSGNRFEEEKRALVALLVSYARNQPARD